MSKKSNFDVWRNQEVNWYFDLCWSFSCIVAFSCSSHTSYATFQNFSRSPQKNVLQGFRQFWEASNCWGWQWYFKISNLVNSEMCSVKLQLDNTGKSRSICEKFTLKSVLEPWQFQEAGNYRFWKAPVVILNFDRFEQSQSLVCAIEESDIIYAEQD